VKIIPPWGLLSCTVPALKSRLHSTSGDQRCNYSAPAKSKTIYVVAAHTLVYYRFMPVLLVATAKPVERGINEATPREKQTNSVMAGI
jgi:hypothetical protein